MSVIKWAEQAFGRGTRTDRYPGTMMYWENHQKQMPKGKSTYYMAKTYKDLTKAFKTRNIHPPAGAKGPITLKSNRVTPVNMAFSMAKMGKFSGSASKHGAVPLNRSVGRANKYNPVTKGSGTKTPRIKR